MRQVMTFTTRLRFLWEAEVVPSLPRQTDCTGYAVVICLMDTGNAFPALKRPDTDVDLSPSHTVEIKAERFIYNKFGGWAVFDLSNTEISGSNPARYMIVCAHFSVLCWRV
jgi:hypothetical protein